MREMLCNNGNKKRRVYHLPLDGYTDIFDAFDHLESDEFQDFQTQDHVEDDSCSPSSLPFWMIKSSSKSNKYIQYNDDGFSQENDCGNQLSFPYHEASERKNYKMENTSNSSFELSFRDIVGDASTCSSSSESKEDVKKKIREEDSFYKPKGITKVYGRSKSFNGAKTRRMSNDGFLLKMFIPSSLRLKAKSHNSRKSSTVGIGIH